MIELPSQITESIIPISAGIIVSLINKYILNNERFNNCCETVEEEVVDSESEESIETIKTEKSDAISSSSAITVATLPSHPIHVHHYFVSHF